MTFKNIFEKLGFKTVVNSDFCILLTGHNAEYALFENIGIKCIDLSTYKEVSMDFISYRYDVEMADLGDEQNEYKFEHTITRENIINFLFGLVELTENNVDNLSQLKQYFGDDIHYRKDEDMLALSLFSIDQKIKNVILFNESSYRLLFSNTECCWINDRGQNKAVIAYNPFDLCHFCYNNNENFATFIMCKETSRFYQELPLTYNFEQYTLICKTATEKKEALKFIVSYIVSKGIANLSVDFYRGWGELIFILDKDESILKYIQYNADALKDLRKIYLNSENQNIVTIKNQRRELNDKKLLYTALNLNVAELDVLTNGLIKLYNLPFNIYDE